MWLSGTSMSAGWVSSMWVGLRRVRAASASGAPSVGAAVNTRAKVCLRQEQLGDCIRPGRALQWPCRPLPFTGAGARVGQV
jgi:hypothetical protein